MKGDKPPPSHTPKAYIKPTDKTGTPKLMYTQLKHATFTATHHATIVVATAFFPIIYAIEKTPISVSNRVTALIEYMQIKHEKPE